MPKYSLEYIAGLFDGEGCVLISRRTRKRHATPVYDLVVNIANTYYPVLAQLKTQHGGTVTSSKRTNKPCYSWTVTNMKAVDFLTAIQPHCVIKLDQVNMALEFHSERAYMKGNRPVTDEELALREGYKLALQEAKRVIYGNTMVRFKAVT